MIFLCLAGVLWWEVTGAAWVRRHFYAPSSIDDSARTESYFVALLFPRITTGWGRYTLKRGDLEEVLKGLKSLGYTPIGLKDLEAFYFKRGGLPPKSVLIAFDRDDPSSVHQADLALRRLRWRGAVFLAQGESRSGPYKRHWLSRHAIAQMRKAGAWDFGSAVSPDPNIPAREFTFSTPSGELRFTPSLTGFNDDRQDPSSLNILPVRGGRAVADIILAIHRDQPRRGELADRFSAPKLDEEWIAGWGAVSTSHRRLVILPTPGQTGAAVSLRGTDGWQDMALEFSLERYRKSFWAYARYRDPSHYVRVGASDGYWLVQQRRSSLTGPSLLGRIPVREGSLPARVRLVVKGDSALLFLDGRMQFGKALRLDPSVDRGRIELSVYDPAPKAAIAALSFVRAKPLGRKWVALTSEDVSSPGVLGSLREEAVEASAISPLWLKAGPGGGLSSVAVRQRDVVWSFAGYYRCRLVPMADLTALGPDADRALGALADQARSLQAEGLNLRLSAAQGAGAARLVAALGRRLRSERRELWITWEGPSVPAWAAQADGILKSAGSPARGVEILENRDTSPIPERTRAGKEVALWR